jgi:Na+/proline symporter
LAFWSGPLFAFLVFISIQWWSNKNADGGGAIIQRMSSCKDERHSMLATLWFNIAHYALRPWPWILVALASIAVFPALEDAEMAYPQMIRHLAGPGLMGVILASLLGAFMSTVDTLLNLSSSYVVNDVYKRFLLPKASEKHYVLVSRIVSIGLVIVSSLIALGSDSISGLFTFLLAFSSGVGLVFILRWFWWRINAWSEISAMITSSVVASVLSILNSQNYLDLLHSIFGISLLPEPLGLSYPAILGATVGASAFVWIVVTFLTKPVSEEKLIAFYRRVRPYGAWGRIAKKAGVEPPHGLAGLVVNWLAGTVMVLALTLSVGKFLLGSSHEGWIYLAAAAAGAAVISREVLRRTAKRST